MPFENPWPDSEPRNFGHILKWMRERRKQPRAATPARGSFPTATPDVVHPRRSRDEFAATWIGHSTVLLQAGGINIITDPVFCDRAFPVQWMGPRRVMDPALALEQLPPLDVVLLSHNHYDHLDKDAVRRMARAHPEVAWVTPLKLGRTIRSWGARHIVELNWWQTIEVRGLTVTATPARHFSARTPFDRNRTLWCGYGLATAGSRFYFAGDTAYHPEFGEIGARCGPFDFIMMPIGAYDPRWFMHVVHVDPEEAVQVYADLTASHPEILPQMLGLHWGTFRLTDEPMEEPPRCAAAEWRRRGLNERLLWVAAFGETRTWRPLLSGPAGR